MEFLAVPCLAYARGLTTARSQQSRSWGSKSAGARPIDPGAQSLADRAGRPLVAHLFGDAGQRPGAAGAAASVLAPGVPELADGEAAVTGTERVRAGRGRRERRVAAFCRLAQERAAC